MLRASPELVLRPWRDLELRYEYIYFHMGIEPVAFLESAHWADLDLQEIIQRLKFMRKCGVYHLPDEKRPQYAMVR